MVFLIARSPSANLTTAQAGIRGFGLLSALRTHTTAPYKTDLLWETLRALNRPGRARTVLGRRELHLVLRGLEAGLAGGRRFVSEIEVPIILPIILVNLV